MGREMEKHSKVWGGETKPDISGFSFRLKVFMIMILLILFVTQGDVCVLYVFSRKQFLTLGILIPS